MFRVSDSLYSFGRAFLFKNDESTFQVGVEALGYRQVLLSANY
jgi:hypothetical protein